MTGEEATVAVIDALEALAIPYMLVGSFSSNYYGIPRATQDADFVVQMERKSCLALVERLGTAFRLDPQASFELVTGTVRHALQLVGSPFEIELFQLSDDTHDRERFARRRRVKLLGRATFLPTAEDVVITKLRWSQGGRRGKDVDDVRNVIAVQRDRIAWDYVYRWCEEHGTRDLVEQIRSSIPPM